MSAKAKAKFLERVEKSSRGCWLWMGSKVHNGYGQLMFSGKMWRAHRLSWAFEFGAIPAGCQILHKCDNRDCVNPKHLYTGTHQDNMEDMTKRNRQAKGSRHGVSKLTENQALEIKASLLGGCKSKDIAHKYNLTPSTVSHIKTGRTWGWLN